MISKKSLNVNLMEADGHLESLEKELQAIFWSATSDEPITAQDLVDLRRALTGIDSHAKRILGCFTDVARQIEQEMKE